MRPHPSAVEEPTGDPAGTEPKRGNEILQLYTNALSGGAKVELTGPVRISAKAAAFPLRVEINGADGQVTTIEDILILEFNPAGKVAKMTAHWGPADMTVKNLVFPLSRRLIFIFYFKPLNHHFKLAMAPTGYLTGSVLLELRM